MATDALHVTGGDVTADLLRRAGLAAAALVWADVLHEGPVPEGLDADGLRRARAGFLAGVDGIDAADVRRRFEARDRALAAGRDGRYLLWFEADPPELRFLGEAFDRLGREYPSTRDGLSLTERRLLAAAAAEPGATAAAAFTRMGEREPRPFLGDLFGFRILSRLAAVRAPLVEAGPPGGVAAATRLRVTEAGRRVLAGQADHVARNGLDRWVGGVHLHGEAARWRWDDGIEAIVEPAPGPGPG
jgi:hypothetical protein